MKMYLLNLWDAARSSYWFVPSLFAIGALLLSLFMPRIDSLIVDLEWKIPEWILTTTDAARATLSALAGAMIAVTGTVFSITVVTLSMTSQQFGPRLLRRFMYDLTTQVTLGVFLSTGLYCLLLLRSVDQHGDASVPHLAILTAVVMAVTSMAMLIGFIHHVAMLIQAPHVVAAVARDLDDAIVRLFPERIGEPATSKRFEGDTVQAQESKLGERSSVVLSEREGYIQAIDGDMLLQLARERQFVLRLRSRPGDFITIGTPLADVWSDERPEEEDEFADLGSPFNDAVIAGVRRTPRQDVECAIDELVEVAVRSLSPGINDPFTAMNCIDRLGASLGRLAERKLSSPYRYDADGRLRVIARPVSFADVLDAAFNQIRQYGRESVAVSIRILEALTSIADHAQRDEDRKAIQLHGEMTARSRESFDEEFDQRTVDERFLRLRNLCEG